MMKKKMEFNISAADKKLFNKMRKSASSVAESRFFTTLKGKEMCESAFSNELLVSEKENADGIYLIRKYYDTYIIGYLDPKGHVEECECDTLASALSMRLDLSVGFPEETTLHDWLRKYNYSVVRYNKNYDKD